MQIARHAVHNISAVHDSLSGLVWQAMICQTLHAHQPLPLLAAQITSRLCDVPFMLPHNHCCCLVRTVDTSVGAEWDLITLQWCCYCCYLSLLLFDYCHMESPSQGTVGSAQALLVLVLSLPGALQAGSLVAYPCHTGCCPEGRCAERSLLGFLACWPCAPSQFACCLHISIQRSALHVEVANTEVSIAH